MDGTVGICKNSKRSKKINNPKHCSTCILTCFSLWVGDIEAYQKTWQIIGVSLRKSKFFHGVRVALLSDDELSDSEKCIQLSIPRVLCSHQYKNEFLCRTSCTQSNENNNNNRSLIISNFTLMHGEIFEESSHFQFVFFAEECDID